MNVSVVTLLPEIINGGLSAGVVARGREAGLIAVRTINPRDFTFDKHRTVDDTPYGGGPGMVMKAPPLLAAIAVAERPWSAPAELASSTLVQRTVDGAPHVTVPPSSLGIPGGADLDLPEPRVHSERAGYAWDDDAISAVVARRGCLRIALTPGGRPLTQGLVAQLARVPHLVMVCGRYEGIDQRVLDYAIDLEISIGDYVLSGGELGALVLIDAVARLVPGVLGDAASADDESFASGLLEYPQYTRPVHLSLPRAAESEPASDMRNRDIARGELGGAAPNGSAQLQYGVPQVLASGNHQAIGQWRHVQSMVRTAVRRPDLWRQYSLDKRAQKLAQSAPELTLAARTYIALVHHPVYDKRGTLVTTALTNLDLHDIARSATTYGLAGYCIVTPVTSQREKAEHIAAMWHEIARGEHRAAALARVSVAADVASAAAAISSRHGHAPSVVATSASRENFSQIKRMSPVAAAQRFCAEPAPLLLLFGTGWGLADQHLPMVTHVLEPINGATDWNHLSVRSAVAVTLDRLFGQTGPQIVRKA